MLTIDLILRALSREPAAILALAAIFGLAVVMVGVFGDIPE